MLAEAKSERPVPVNVGNDDERSVLEMASLFTQIAAASQRTEFVPARPGVPQRRRPDLERARSFGWHPNISLGNGLRMTLEWATLEQDNCA
jgi:nucleoside-diphosphate-sugar epimerase